MGSNFLPKLWIVGTARRLGAKLPALYVLLSRLIDHFDLARPMLNKLESMPVSMAPISALL
jgi:hypothetical protein